MIVMEDIVALIWPAAALLAGILLGLASFQVLRQPKMAALARKEIDLSARLRAAEEALETERAASAALRDELSQAEAEAEASEIRILDAEKDLAEIQSKYEAALSMANHAGIGITSLRSENKALKAALAAKQAPPDLEARLLGLEEALEARNLEVARLEIEVEKARAQATRIVPALPTTETPGRRADSEAHFAPFPNGPQAPEEALSKTASGAESEAGAPSAAWRGGLSPEAEQLETLADKVLNPTESDGDFLELHDDDDPLPGETALFERDAKKAAADDDLTRIEGIGDLTRARLRELGITSLQQIADFTPEDVERLSDDPELAGQIEREHWVEQARSIVAGAERGLG